MPKWRKNWFPDLRGTSWEYDESKRDKSTPVWNSPAQDLFLSNNDPYSKLAHTSENRWKFKDSKNRKNVVKPTYEMRVGSDGRTYTVPTYPKNTADSFEMLVDENGRPYTVPAGVMAGKFVAFDNWTADEEKKAKFERAFLNKDRTGDNENVSTIEESEGHIIRIQYNDEEELMRVEFRNKGSICVYSHVPNSIFVELAECEGRTRGSGPHNHMLGIRFWDLIRIRGTWHGSTVPFYYERGNSLIADRLNSLNNTTGKKLYEDREKRWNEVGAKRQMKDWRDGYVDYGSSGMTSADRAMIKDVAERMMSRQVSNNNSDRISKLRWEWNKLVNGYQQAKANKDEKKAEEMLEKEKQFVNLHYRTIVGESEVDKEDMDV